MVQTVMPTMFDTRSSAAKAIKLAINEAGGRQRHVDYVHGTSAMRRWPMLGKVPVSSTKSQDTCLNMVPKLSLIATIKRFVLALLPKTTEYPV